MEEDGNVVAETLRRGGKMLDRSGALWQAFQENLKRLVLRNNCVVVVELWFIVCMAVHAPLVLNNWPTEISNLKIT